MNVVVNYDLPMDSQSYIHRVGRAARFGKKAIAVSFIRDQDNERLITVKNEINIKIHPLPDKINPSFYA